MRAPRAGLRRHALHCPRQAAGDDGAVDGVDVGVVTRHGLHVREDRVDAQELAVRLPIEAPRR
eukprot:7181766-Prymnesium_polylepis.1